MNKTWLSAPPAKDDDQCKLIDTGNTLGTGKGMHMPAGGLEGCKEMCNGIQDCHAIEYAPSHDGNAPDCCILVNCTGGSVPTPMETGNPGGIYHPGDASYMYKGYIKDCGGCQMGHTCTETGCKCGTSDACTGDTPMCYTDGMTHMCKCMGDSCTSDPEKRFCDTGACTGCKVDGQPGNNMDPKKGNCADGQKCCNSGECK